MENARHTWSADHVVAFILTNHKHGCYMQDYTDWANRRILICRRDMA